MSEPTLQQIKYLVFSGGSIRGFAFAPALLVIKHAFARAGVPDYLHTHIRGAAGSSVGALVALLVCCGLSESAVKQEMKSLDLPKFIRRASLSHFYNHYGATSHDELEELVRHFLVVAGYAPNITLRRFEQLSGKRLRVTATVINAVSTERAKFIDADTCPGMQVARAVAMSMALAPLFDPYEDRAPGAEQMPMYIIDGSFSNNLPTDAFDPRESLCFLLHLPDEPVHITGHQTFWECVVRALISQIDDLKQQLNDHAHVINIVTPSMSPFEFDTSDDTLRALIEPGYLAACKWANISPDDPELLAAFNELGGLGAAPSDTVDSSVHSMRLQATLVSCFALAGSIAK